MLLSSILIYSGFASYVAVWILYIIVNLFFNLREPFKTAFFVYALIPFGCIMCSGSGIVLSIFGI